MKSGKSSSKSGPVKLHQLIHAFTSQFSALIRDGLEPNDEIVQDIVSRHESFKEAVFSHHPDFRPVTKAEKRCLAQDSDLRWDETVAGQELTNDSTTAMDVDDIIALLRRLVSYLSL